MAGGTVTINKGLENKAICQNPKCKKRGRYQSLTNFYKSRSGEEEHHPFCKDCVDDMIDINNLDTVYSVLRKLNIPFIYKVWKKVCLLENEKQFRHYLKEITFTNKKYYSDYRWNDSEFQDTSLEDVEEEIILEEPKVNSRAKTWSDEWQGEYTKKELDYLNGYYEDLQKDFKIVTRNHRDYARKIAQASLVMNSAFRQMRDNPMDKDLAGIYKAASANFDALSKSAQFAESQRGANDVSLGCFGRVFDAVEKHQWIPEYVPDDKDMYDKLIEQFANINKSL